MQLLSARGAQKKKDESKKLQMYSKQWLPGDVMRVFIPIFWQDGRPEIAVGAVWGHNVSDIKGLGLKTAFIPSTTDFDENALPIGVPDITYQFSQIARVFVNGAKAVEEAAIMKKPWPNESSRKEALKALEEKYDTKNNRKAVRPIISRAQYLIMTEVVSLKLVNDVPNVETIELSSMPLSNQTITRIYALMDDPKYAPKEGDEFFEIEWKYPVNADKGESGRAAAPAGLTEDYTLRVRHADAYRTVSAKLSTVMRSPETIVRRATRSIDPARVKAAITQYAFLNSEYLDATIEEDEELLIKHADLVKELDITRAITNEELSAKIQNALKELEVKRPEVPVEIPSPVAAAEEVTPLTNIGVVEGAPTLQGIISETEVPVTPIAPAEPVTPIMPTTPSIQNLMNNVHNAGANGDEFDNVDFATTV